MKDLFEYLLTSLYFGEVSGWDIKFDGHKIPIVIVEEINNSLFLQIFNLNFFYTSSIKNTL